MCPLWGGYSPQCVLCGVVIVPNVSFVGWLQSPMCPLWGGYSPQCVLCGVVIVPNVSFVGWL